MVQGNHAGGRLNSTQQQHLAAAQLALAQSPRLQPTPHTRILYAACHPQEAHETGVALVVACAQDQAETYVETLRLNGLISSMEPGH